MLRLLVSILVFVLSCEAGLPVGVPVSPVGVIDAALLPPSPYTYLSAFPQKVEKSPPILRDDGLLDFVQLYKSRDSNPNLQRELRQFVSRNGLSLYQQEQLEAILGLRPRSTVPGIPDQEKASPAAKKELSAKELIDLVRTVIESRQQAAPQLKQHQQYPSYQPIGIVQQVPTYVQPAPATYTSYPPKVQYANSFQPQPSPKYQLSNSYVYTQQGNSFSQQQQQQQQQNNKRYSAFSSDHKDVSDLDFVKRQVRDQNEKIFNLESDLQHHAFIIRTLQDRIGELEGKVQDITRSRPVVIDNVVRSDAKMPMILDQHLKKKIY